MVRQVAGLRQVRVGMDHVWPPWLSYIHYMRSGSSAPYAGMSPPLSHHLRHPLDCRAHYFERIFNPRLVRDPYRQYFRAAHLLPVFDATPLPRTFNYTKILDSFQGFYVNRYVDITIATKPSCRENLTFVSVAGNRGGLHGRCQR